MPRELTEIGRLCRAKLRHIREQKRETRSPARRHSITSRRRRLHLEARGPEPAPNALLAPGEIARLLNVSTKTVRRWATNEGLPSFRTIGGHRRYRWADVKRWLNRTAPDT
jgi:excisionase family DNA binding protein